MYASTGCKSPQYDSTDFVTVYLCDTVIITIADDLTTQGAVAPIGSM